MLEQFIYDRISQDETLQDYLSAGSDGINLYPGVVPAGVEDDMIVTFTLITTRDSFPAVLSRSVQFNIFTKTHTDGVVIAQALADLFNDNKLQTEDGVKVVYSIRESESDLGFNYDDKYYQREATYAFKMR